MTDNVAVLSGFTREVMAEAGDGSHSLFLLLKPDTDLDSEFMAWDSDNQEFLLVKGWMYNFNFAD